MHKFIIIAILILIGVLVLLQLFRLHVDKFANIGGYWGFDPDYEYYRDPWYYTHSNYPFWNTQLGTKRNMSYDLRGDVSINSVGWVPFNMSSWIPIRNRPLWA